MVFLGQTAGVVAFVCSAYPGSVSCVVAEAAANRGAKKRLVMTAINRISAFATTALMAPMGIAKAACSSTRLAERKFAKQSANSFLSFNFYTLAGWSSTTNQQLYDISYHDLLQPNSMMT